MTLQWTQQQHPGMSSQKLTKVEVFVELRHGEQKVLLTQNQRKSVDVKTVDEPAKSPGRRGRSKPQLIVTPIDKRAGGDAEIMAIKEVDGKMNFNIAAISI